MKSNDVASETVTQQQLNEAIQTDKTKPFEHYPSALLLSCLIFAIPVVLYIFVDKATSLNDTFTEFQTDALIFVIWAVSLVSIICGTFAFSKVKINEFFLTDAASIDYKEVINLTAFLIAFSLLIIEAQYSFLNAFLPSLYDFYQSLSRSGYFVDEQTNEFSIWGSVIFFVSIVIVAPIFEELFFRGFLLNKLTNVWSARTAVIVTSVFFGILHPDPIGATLFGVLMCLLYMKTRSLLAPIIAHFFNNFVAWLIMFIDWKFFESSLSSWEHANTDWLYIGIMSIVCIVWAVSIYFSRHNPMKWELKHS